MELDVHIKREGEESWGFRLIGGKEFNMPLTVVKVIPDSPADRAGLQNGDAVCCINDADACGLAHDEAKMVVAEAKDTLSLAVKRGLYDPVLDEYDPIYEPIDQEDFDQPSQPTEVDPFQVQQFLDPKQYPQQLADLPELRDIEIPNLNGTIDRSRSLTASPFVLPTKPYRPFSTDPLPVPPLEDPIILNPNYQDDFLKIDDGEVFPETKYKLPISEQYDPDGSKARARSESVKTTKEIRFAEDSMKKDVTFTEKKKETKFSEVTQKMTIEEMNFMETMKKEIDLDKIEMTAMNLVDESIEKAVSVADEIKKEIDVELDSSMTAEIKESKFVKQSSQVTSQAKAQESVLVAKITKKNEASELVELIDKTTEEIISLNGSKAEVCVAKEVQKFETIDKMEKQVDERKLSTKQELEETIVAGSVRRKSEVFDKKEEVKDSGVKESVERKKSVDKQAETKVLEVEDRKRASEAKSVSQSANEIKKETISTSQKSGMTSLDSKSSSKRTAEQKAYTIGLQTIPNIKGTIHSSYHYNLLLKTFFLHLTDVMVALSRFILTESIFDKDGKQDVREELTTGTSSQYTTVSKEKIVSEKASVDKNKHKEKEMIAKKAEEVKQDLIEEQKETKKVVKDVVAQHKQEVVKEAIVQHKQEVVKEAVAQHRQEVIHEASPQDEVQINQLEYKKVEEDAKDYLIVEDVAETRMLSGAKMAQLTERKSEELTNKMDAVISEFETKARIEESAVVRQRRSRSRSKVEEEVTLESDPLEWLSKKEMKNESQHITETKSEAKSFSSTAESMSKKRLETLETRELRTSQTKEEPQMYVAIVESHVYTNKDAIFAEMAKEFSETSSTVSAKKTNIALQSSEIVATEQVALQTSEMKKEVGESVLEESRELAVVNVCSEKIEMEEEVKLAVHKAISEEVVVQMADKVSSVHEAISEEGVVEMAEEEKSVHEAISKKKVVEVNTEGTNEVSIQEIIEPVVEVQELKLVEIVKDIQKVSVKEEEHIMTVSEKSEVIEFEAAKHEVLEEVKHDEYVIIAEEEHKAVDKAVIEVPEIKTEKIEQPIQVVETSLNVHLPARLTPTRDEASAELSIIKEAVFKDERTLQLTEESELLMSKHTEIHETDNQYSAIHKSTAESYKSEEITQDSSFTAQLVQSSESKTQESSISAIKSSEERKKLSLQLGVMEEKKFKSQYSVQSEPASTINTPTPATVPPTPLTDEYVFKLQIPLPKSQSTTPITKDPSPEVDEDPNIVKKKLVPHIETTLESPIIYDPPLASPPGDKVTSPVYSKPGLRGGAERRRSRKEEILEIERKSSLLASAIDETIKSIEEYKEEVGIENKKEEDHVIIKKSSTVSSLEKVTKQETIANQPVIYNGYAKVETKVYDSVLKDASKIDEEWNTIDKQVKESNEKLIELSNKVEVQMNGTCDMSTEDSETETKSDVKLVENSKDTSLVNGVDKMEITSLNDVKNADNKQVNDIENSKDMHKIRFSDEVECKIVEIEPKESVISETTATKNFDHIDLPKVAFCGVDTSSSMMTVEKKDPMEGYRPVAFNPEEILAAKQQLRSIHLQVQAPQVHRASSPGYVTPTGELLGTNQGIVDGLEEAVVDLEVAKELGKPGMTEDKIAELISGESEMLREAHVMGSSIASDFVPLKIFNFIYSFFSFSLINCHASPCLSRVLKSHMHRADDDSSVDFKKIKPIIESLKDSEVLKALNEELIRTREEKKKEEEKKWTKFLQKPSRPVPKAKFGYYGYVQEEEKIEVPYKVKIVKQPKPKVAPDYKPEDFETGPLPWEERALKEPPPPPVPPEDPILIPEAIPEFLEAVDPLQESEVPDLEETGIRLPSPKPEEEEQSSPALVEDTEDTEEQPEELDIEAVVKETEEIAEEMEQNRLAEQLMMGVQSMVDPNASIDQQLAQMRAQVAALAQLPGFIQQTLDLVTKQLCHLSHQETQQITSVSESESHVQSQSQALVEVTHMESNEVNQTQSQDANEEVHQNSIQEEEANEKLTITEVEETKPSLTQEEMEKLRKEEEEMLEEQRRIEKQKKDMMEQMRLEQESRQVKQHPTPRVGKPKPVFGPPEPVARPLVLPGGRKWRKPEDAYNEQFIAETLSAQAELIQGKAKGFSYESDILPYDERINFMKYEKPPVSLDHLQNSETYKLIHNMEQTPVKRVEMRTPVIAEADYREKCRSVTPSMNMPQQVHP